MVSEFHYDESRWRFLLREANDFMIPSLSLIMENLSSQPHKDRFLPFPKYPFILLKSCEQVYEFLYLSIISFKCCLEEKFNIIHMCVYVYKCICFKFEFAFKWLFSVKTYFFLCVGMCMGVQACS